jgi:hypothetical protein
LIREERLVKRSDCGRAFLIRKRQSAQIGGEDCGETAGLAYASHPALRRPSSISAWPSGRCHGSSPADKHVESGWCDRNGLCQHFLCFPYATCLAEGRGCARTRRWPRCAVRCHARIPAPRSNPNTGHKWSRQRVIGLSVAFILPGLWDPTSRKMVRPYRKLPSPGARAKNRAVRYLFSAELRPRIF